MNKMNTNLYTFSIFINIHPTTYARYNFQEKPNYSYIMKYTITSVCVNVHIVIAAMHILV